MITPAERNADPELIGYVDGRCVGNHRQKCAREATVIVAGVGAQCAKHARFTERYDRRAGEPYEARPVHQTTGHSIEGAHDDA